MYVPSNMFFFWYLCWISGVYPTQTSKMHVTQPKAGSRLDGGSEASPFPKLPSFQARSRVTTRNDGLRFLGSGISINLLLLVSSRQSKKKQVSKGGIQVNNHWFSNCCWWFRNPKANHLGCIINPVNNWDIYHIFQQQLLTYTEVIQAKRLVGGHDSNLWNGHFSTIPMGDRSKVANNKNDEMLALENPYICQNAAKGCFFVGGGAHNFWDIAIALQIWKSRRIIVVDIQ